MDIDSDAFLAGSNAGRTTNLAQNRLEGVEINPDGTKLFLVFTNTTADDNVGARLYEFNLSKKHAKFSINLSV